MIAKAVLGLSEVLGPSKRPLASDPRRASTSASATARPGGVRA